MNRLIVAFESEKQRCQVGDILAAGGLPADRLLSGPAETVRAARKMGGCVVVTGYKMGGQNADELAYQLEGRALVLVIAPQPQLDFLDSQDIFTLPVPFTRTELLSSVRMLCQMAEKLSHLTAPRRDQAEQAAVQQAKALLMERQGLSEAQAHQALQRASMNSGRKLVELAREMVQTMAKDG